MATRHCQQWTAGLLLLGLALFACKRPDPNPGSQPARPPMQAPTFEGTQALSFSYPYASSLRNAQVHVQRRRYESWQRKLIAYCPPPIDDPGRNPPFALVVSPNGRHVVLSSQTRSDLVDDGPCATMGGSGDVVALDDEVFFSGGGSTWDRKHLEQRNVYGPAYARRIEGQRYAAVVPAPTEGPGFTQSPTLLIEGGRRYPKHLGDGREWSHFPPGEAVAAAIGADFTVVVLFKSGMLRVFLPVPEGPNLNPTLFAERDVGTGTWLSLVGNQILIVLSTSSGSRMQAFAADTSPLYTLAVPFEVFQPPIAGNGKRFYVAGKGLAAIDNGKLTWSHASTETMYASAFADGSLAVATGKRLDFVKRDGTVDQSFTAEEPLVAPPAIASDGSVWAASATALYVAR